MAIEYYKATADTGGVIGTQILSGVRNALLPKLTAGQRLSGINIKRKFYTKNTGAGSIDLILAMDNHGEFEAVMFESTGDAQVVGDLTGSEDRYGACPIVQLEDTISTTETVNGAGGLVNIKKIVVTEHPDYVVYRVGDKIGIGGALGEVAEISVVTDLGSTTEITFLTEITYFGAIGKMAHSYIENTIATTAHASYWLEVIVPANSTTSVTANPISLAEVY